MTVADFVPKLEESIEEDAYGAGRTSPFVRRILVSRRPDPCKAWDDGVRLWSVVWVKGT